MPRAGRCYVRVNELDTQWCLQDLLAVVQHGLDGIVLPKVSRGDQVRTADWVLTQLEQARGLEPGSIDLIPMVETAAGLLRAVPIGRASRRVKRIAFGAADLSTDAGFTPTAGEDELAGPRAQLAIASRAAGIEAPIDAVWFDLEDPEGLAASVARARGLGFQGKLCVHPAQLEVVNRGFAPGEDEVAAARRIVEAFRKAEAGGAGAIRVDGRMVDLPIAVQAERLLERDAEVRARGAR